MQPVTPREKLLAFERVRSCANSLIHDGAITYGEFRILINRAIQLFGHPDENKEEECHTQDHPNGEL